MPSPAKKRKLNGDSKQAALPSRGLEYFFTKQRKIDASSSSAIDTDGVSDVTAPEQGNELTDEELARKLQAEWDQETAPEATRDAASTSPGKAAGQSANDLKFKDQKLDSSSSLKETSAASPKGKGTLSLQSVAASADTVSETIPFDESPLSFDPDIYIPQLKAHWASEGGNASYALLTRCFVLVNGTQSRIKIVDTLVNCLRVLIEGDPESLLPAVCP